MKVHAKTEHGAKLVRREKNKHTGVTHVIAFSYQIPYTLDHGVLSEEELEKFLKELKEMMKQNGYDTARCWACTGINSAYVIDRRTVDKDVLKTFLEKFAMIPDDSETPALMLDVAVKTRPAKTRL